MKFTIPGEPCGKARPRVVRKGNFTRAYTPENTASYENLVKLEFQQAANGFFVTEHPVHIEIAAYFGIPKSASKRKTLQMLDGVILPTKKPDCDNIMKIICDALNSLAYKDDSQIADARITKRYSDIPRVDVTIEEVQDESNQTLIPH